MKSKPVIVHNVLQGSIAEEAGVERGDMLLSINNEKVKDIFDYRFLISEEELLLEVQKADGELWEIEIEKDETEDLGIEFESSMIDEAKSCTNKCIFCFIDQLPDNMRDTLYFKDDDSRLSFLTGNYVTLTNMKDDDIDRIVKYRMSPINVSVHTTNPELRISMLNNKSAGNVLERIKRLTESGIIVNCQIVLCRGINDGAELDRSIADLAVMYPNMRSISVVPVGLTKHRKGLKLLEPFDRQTSGQVIRQVEDWQKKFLEQYDSRIVYLADEFYIMAGEEIPGYEDYEDFPQIENGVGLIASLIYEFNQQLVMIKNNGLLPSLNYPDNARNVSIATGVSSYKYVKQMSDELKKNFKNININVYEIKNDFFGENVTVTGLLTGKDIVSQLKEKELGQELLISSSMLRAGEDVFLDDYTVDKVGRELGVNISVVDNNGKDFIEKVLDIII